MKLLKRKEKLGQTESIEINLPMYPIDIHCFTPAMEKKLVQECGWDSIQDAYGATGYYPEENVVVVRFQKDDVNTVAHEMYHAVEFINKHIGHDIGNKTDEPSAYLIGYLIEEYYKCKKKTKTSS